ncbi:MAG TPA: integrin alpha [Dehalococcoidia bacterium]|nr:integrin alpha [Dehalococcoidia bacterium]
MVDLAQTAPATAIWGADAGDYLNDLPALTSGDVNGDGLDDLLIGARFGDGPANGRADAGEAYLVFGRQALPPELDLAAMEAGVTIFGAHPNDQLGYDAILADVNDDGLQDVLLGAPFAPGTEGGAPTGVVYIILGAAEMESVLDLSTAGADAVLIGPENSSYFGDALASADFNGDGSADILIGAPFARRPPGAQNARAQAGAAYVIFGGPDALGTRDISRGEYDIAVFGVNDSPHPDELGDRVAGGDLNADGLDDLIITAEAADGPDDARSVAAEVHVIFGAADLSGVLDLAAGDQDLTVWGAEQNDTLGFNLATGDVNGDGVDDLLMTARGGDGEGNSIQEGGELHLVLGRRDLPGTIDLAAGEGDAYVFGSDQAEMLAYGLAAADLNADGTAEVLIGTPFGDGPAGDRPESGEVFALDLRSAPAPAGVLSLPRFLSIFGGQEDDGLGAAVTAGDMDGDGKPEVIVLAILGDGRGDSRPDAGEIVVLRLPG